MMLPWYWVFRPLASPSERGSTGRAQIQKVKYQIEKWNRLGKRLGYCTCSGEGNRGEGYSMMYNAVSNLHLHGIKTCPLQVSMCSTYINASLRLSQLGTLSGS